MAAEEGMRFIRQYSDEGRQLALRVSVKLHIIIIFKFNIIFLFKTIGENSHVETMRATTRNAWAAVLRAVDALKQAASELPNPEIVYEQLRILLRDESK